MHFSTTFRWVEISLGALLLYLRFCLYEDEEGKLQDALVDLWDRIDDRAKSTRRRAVALLDETARISRTLLDRMFGPRIVSAQAISVSLLLAMSSIWIAVIVHRTLYSHSGGAFFLLVPIALIAMSRKAFPTLEHLFQVRIVRLGVIYFFLGAVLVTTCFGVFISVARGSGVWRTLQMPSFYLAVFILDAAWVAIYRWISNIAREDSGLFLHCIAILVGLAISIMVCFGFSKAVISQWLLPEPVEGLLLDISASRWLVVAVSLFQSAILLAAIGHWFVWPILARVIYGLERAKFLKERSWFGTAGAALLAHAWSGIGWNLL